MHWSLKCGDYALRACYNNSVYVIVNEEFLLTQPDHCYWRSQAEIIMLCCCGQCTEPRAHQLLVRFTPVGSKRTMAYSQMLNYNIQVSHPRKKQPCFLPYCTNTRTSQLSNMWYQTIIFSVFLIDQNLDLTVLQRLTHQTLEQETEAPVTHASIVSPLSES